MSGFHRDGQSSGTYEFRIRGQLGDIMLSAFPTLTAEMRPGYTLLRGAFSDQAALYGVLAQLEALGLELLELRRVDQEHSDRPQPDRADAVD